MKNTSPLSQIYLDANATTPVLPQAAAAAVNSMKVLFGNPSSSHITGLKAKDLMEQTRANARKVIGADTGNVIFTSGATEGIQTAIISALVEAKKSLDSDKQYSLLYGATEHKAVPESLKHWNQILGINADIKAIPVDGMGNLDKQFIEKEAPSALMICTMAVNNETGVYQDLLALEQIIRHANKHIFWMVDCVQALGKTPLNLAETTIDYAPFSGHKLYAPKGIGFVYIRQSAPFTPIIAGGGQESGLRSGTENLPGMAAINVIFEMLLNEQDSVFANLDTLRGYQTQLVNTLNTAFPEVVYNHSVENSVPTTINFAISGFSSKEIMDLFDAANIRVSSGSACSSKVTRSFVLDAMGLPAWQSESAIRLSFGPAITQTEVDQACQRITSAAKALTHSCMILDNGEIDEKQPLNGLVQLRFASNCTWVYADQQSKQAFIIDPLPELNDRLDTLLQCQQLELVAVIDTHGHADHQSGRTFLADKHLPTQQTDALGWPQACLQHSQLQYIEIGHQWLVKVATPGHTDDSMTLLLCSPFKDKNDIKQQCQFAFCGDTVLMGSLGRTNFDSSSATDMFSSLKLIHSLIGSDTLICASHDYNNEFTTHLSAECQRNPLLRNTLNGQLDVYEFEKLKADLDSHLCDQTGSEIMCGALTDSQLAGQAIVEYNHQSLNYALANDEVTLIDIREPHEYALQHTEDSSENVPLTRLVQFIQQQQQQKHHKWVLVCRSGSRSFVAAQAMHRLGFDNVAHLKGGYALSS
ncbi:aminotransferase class V-fold PLP-dependent enzyme [Shewanella sp. 1_MG-2023]|uniref:aminotransferase class V-fold PLP-dependent enzyme n=1 Tax=unclassified Shewanella TaxID=196818 RepID=UPI0026E3A799|nr:MULTISPECIES: aminotransferase class V-fold PLP-dependent enzyme [unclassified Shewanella]MDO6610762.1 aminotransferase class V-fold PLP-dependent enzyme [Shewanella sp. 7_MG-2023]MDO6770886.1 aminotransferase class V-fold PLP-dependent enzyme [Shewanella sp. 2_MG-2023]MDO6793095.1 aminotransferase class V-fold PLP-dependent enzyme [Shewanella sp. 1_MG-2023]